MDVGGIETEAMYPYTLLVCTIFVNFTCTMSHAV